MKGEISGLDGGSRLVSLYLPVPCFVELLKTDLVTPIRPSGIFALCFASREPRLFRAEAHCRAGPLPLTPGWNCVYLLNPEGPGHCSKPTAHSPRQLVSRIEL